MANNKESGRNIQEDPFLRTARGKIAVLSLSLSMILTAATIAEATKPKPEDPNADYDPNAEMIITSLPSDQWPIAPRPTSYDNVKSVKSIEHILPEGVEKMLEQDNLTKKGE